MPFLNLTLVLKDAIHLLAIYGFLMALYIVIRSWQKADRKEPRFIISRL